MTRCIVDDDGRRCIIDDGGYTLFLDDLDSLLLTRYGCHESANIDLVNNSVGEGDTFVDVGAHIGYYTIFASKIVGETGKVFAFEPDPTNFALLEKNIKANGCENVIAIQKAVSNKTGTDALYISPDNSGDNRIYDSDLGWKTVDVETVRLDDYFKDYDTDIRFVKIDVQGVEGSVLQGMKSILQKNDDVMLLIEFCADVVGQDSTPVLKQLVENGETLYIINPPVQPPDHVSRLTLVSLDELVGMCRRLSICVDVLYTKNRIVVDL